MKRKSLLIIEDNRSLAIAISALAERCYLRPATVPTLARARQALAGQQAQGEPPFDLILLDIGLPDGNGLDLLKNREIPKQCHLAIISAHGDIDHAITARKLGAAHFFNKPIDFDSLEKFLTEYSQDSDQPEHPEQRAEQPDAATSPPLIGASDNMRRVFQHIAQACATTSPVVLRGEFGTGRCHVARLIQANTTPHRHSTFIATAQTKPEDLTTHLIQNPKSTLLFNNLTDLTTRCQQQLLVTLDNLRDQAPRMLVTVDDDGLHQHSLAGRILPDLYYRLQVLEIHLPPLRQRTDDIPALTSYFLGELDSAHTRELSPDLIAALQQYRWPGNLRELRNLISHLVLTHTGTKVLHPHHLPSHFLEQPPLPSRDHLTTSMENWVSRQLEPTEKQLTYKELHSQLEGRLLDILMERFDHKPSHLAKSLRMNRSTLRKKLNERG